jgi:hypothetical protein
MEQNSFIAHLADILATAPPDVVSWNDAGDAFVVYDVER